MKCGANAAAMQQENASRNDGLPAGRREFRNVNDIYKIAKCGACAAENIRSKTIFRSANAFFLKIVWTKRFLFISLVRVKSPKPFHGTFCFPQSTLFFTPRRDAAAAYIEKIDRMGGMLKAIENGFPQREIQEAAYVYQRAVETGDAIVVGVNKFQIQEDKTIPILKVDEQIERNQIESVCAVRQKRDAAKAENALVKLEEAARTNENMLPRILDCVESYVTVGEISHRLRKIWGEYREAVTV